MDNRIKKMQRQTEINEQITALSKEHALIEAELNSTSDIPDWAIRAAEHAFTEADRWHTGVASFDTEKLARIIHREQLKSVGSDYKELVTGKKICRICTFDKSRAPLGTVPTPVMHTEEERLKLHPPVKLCPQCTEQVGYEYRHEEGKHPNFEDEFSR